MRSRWFKLVGRTHNWAQIEAVLGAVVLGVVLMVVAIASVVSRFA